MLTDQAMPGMTGTQLAERIKAQHPDLPTILATGFADLPSSTHPDLIRLNNPFDLTTLARAIGAGLKPVGRATVGRSVPGRDKRWWPRPWSGPGPPP